MNASELQLADLVFIRGTRWLDFPIKLVTNSQYTHVAGFVGAGNLIEAQGLRDTGYQPLEAYSGALDVYRCRSLTQEQIEQILIYAHKQIGGKYDYILIGWEAMRHIFGVMLPYGQSQRRICSTLWADAYKSAGVNLSPEHRYPTPADLVKSPRLRKIGTF